MTRAATKSQPELLPDTVTAELPIPEVQVEDAQAWNVARLRLLWGRRRLLIRATLAGLVASSLGALLLPNQYTSTTRLMPPDTQGTSGMAMMMAAVATRGSGSNLGSMAGDLLGMKSNGALFVGVLKSQTAQDRVVQQFDLRKVYRMRLTTDARLRLDDNTSIVEDRKSGIITVNVTDHNPQRATAIAAAYVDQLNILVAQLSTSAAHRERVFLENRLKVVKQELDDASNQLAQFSSKNNTLDIKDEGKAMLDTAALLAGQLVAAQSQLEGLRQIYTDNNSRIQSLNARVVELRRELEKLSGFSEKSGEGPSKIQGSLGDIPYPTIRNLPLIGVQYADYYRHAKIQETVYELLTQQYELAKVQEAKETPSVKVLDPATVPEKKSSPHRLIIALIGTFLGFAGAALWVSGSKRWDDIDSRDPRKIFVLEVAGTVKAQAPWAAPNGNGTSTRAQKVWNRLAGPRRTGNEHSDH